MERRAASRQLTCIPASFESQREATDLALICDASTTGARLYTQTELALEDPVTLELYLGPEPPAPRRVEARVVRVERRPAMLSGLWPWEIGVEFNQPITAYEKEIEELSRKQEAAGLLKR